MAFEGSETALEGSETALEEAAAAADASGEACCCGCIEGQGGRCQDGGGGSAALVESTE